jgi:hypothetical protein
MQGHDTKQEQSRESLSVIGAVRGITNGQWEIIEGNNQYQCINSQPEHVIRSITVKCHANNGNIQIVIDFNNNIARELVKAPFFLHLDDTLSFKKVSSSKSKSKSKSKHSSKSKFLYQFTFNLRSLSKFYLLGIYLRSISMQANSGHDAHDNLIYSLVLIFFISKFFSLNELSTFRFFLEVKRIIIDWLNINFVSGLSADISNSIRIITEFNIMINELYGFVISSGLTDEDRQNLNLHKDGLNQKLFSCLISLCDLPNGKSSILAELDSELPKLAARSDEKQSDANGNKPLPESYKMAYFRFGFMVLSLLSSQPTIDSYYPNSLANQLCGTSIFDESYNSNDKCFVTPDNIQILLILFDIIKNLGKEFNRINNSQVDESVLPYANKLRGAREEMIGLVKDIGNEAINGIDKQDGNNEAISSEDVALYLNYINIIKERIGCLANLVALVGEGGYINPEYLLDRACRLDYELRKLHQVIDINQLTEADKATLKECHIGIACILMQQLAEKMLPDEFNNLLSSQANKMEINFKNIPSSDAVVVESEFALRLLAQISSPTDQVKTLINQLVDFLSKPLNAITSDTQVEISKGGINVANVEQFIFLLREIREGAVASSPSQPVPDAPHSQFFQPGAEHTSTAPVAGEPPLQNSPSAPEREAPPASPRPGSSSGS